MTALSGAAVELLAAVERGEVVRMPGGLSWNVLTGRQQPGIEPLYRAGLIKAAPFVHPAMDRDCVLTASGAAALAAAREAS